MLHRRTLLAAAALAPLAARAQDGPIVLGSLTPLTGAGGAYGPSMRDVIAAVIKQVNEAGGVLGRQVRLVSEDDQTNPDAGVSAARKLIDVDKVSAIIGTWASKSRLSSTDNRLMPRPAGMSAPGRPGPCGP